MILQGFYVKCPVCGKMHTASVNRSFYCSCGESVSEMTMAAFIQNNETIKRVTERIGAGGN